LTKDCEDVKGSSCSLLPVNTPVNFLEETANTKKILGEDGQYPGRDTNWIPNGQNISL
jgi:hypothetical protein